MIELLHPCHNFTNVALHFLEMQYVGKDKSVILFLDVSIQTCAALTQPCSTSQWKYLDCSFGLNDCSN